MKITRLIIGLCCVAQISATNAVKPTLDLAEKRQLKQLAKQEKIPSVGKSSENLIIQTLNPQLRIYL